MKLLTTLLFLFISILTFHLNAQTGPAGVGSSSNNPLWLKADVGTSTTTDGAAISSWNDQSGNGINVSQITTAQKPTYKATLMNGFPAIEFNNNSTAGQNDYLTAANNWLLDSTAGYTIFTVSRLKGLTGDAQSIISKRTNVDIDEAFMFFYYTGNYMYLDIDGLNDRFSTTPTAYSANTNYILDVLYDGTLAAANRSKIYEGETLRKTSTETSSFVGHKSSPLVIGATHTADNRAFNGYIPELIIYRSALNDAQRIIVNNYLSSKYSIPLSANDKYAGDLSANGSYYREVAGVGKESSGPNTQFATSVNGGVGITVNSGLDNGDYILSGYSSTTNTQITTDIGGVNGIAPARWQRIWYWDVTNTATVLNTNVVFNMIDGGVGTVSLGTATDYVLLYRAGQSGNWTELDTATSISGQNVMFTNVNITNDGYYTIGTHNYPVSPLPIELLNFDAVLNSGKVDLSWSTATETNNDYFTIEKTKDGINFEKVATVQGAGNSTSYREYADVDFSPYTGTSYYRLKQTDYNGHFTYSSLVPVNYNSGNEGISIYPNPASAENPINLNISGLENQQILVVIRDVEGREFYSKVIIVTTNNQITVIDSEQKLTPGTYIVIATSNNKIYNQKLIVK